MTRTEWILLTKEQKRELVRKRYYDDLRTQHSIAAEFGISQSMVTQACYGDPRHFERSKYRHPKLPPKSGKVKLTPRLPGGNFTRNKVERLSHYRSIFD